MCARFFHFSCCCFYCCCSYRFLIHVFIITNSRWDFQRSCSVSHSLTQSLSLFCWQRKNLLYSVHKVHGTKTVQRLILIRPANDFGTALPMFASAPESPSWERELARARQRDALLPFRAIAVPPTLRLLWGLIGCKCRVRLLGSGTKTSCLCSCLHVCFCACVCVCVALRCLYLFGVAVRCVPVCVCVCVWVPFLIEFNCQMRD